MEEALIHIPDKFVADDIRNFLTKKTDTHLFSNIYEGKTFINPYNFDFYRNSDSIKLYEGGFGMGYYCELAYSIEQKKYIYYIFDHECEKLREGYKSENWEEIHDHVWKELLDIFISFNN